MTVFLSDNVQKALNRGEAYHQLRRAVAITNGGKFRGNNDREIEMWNNCSRFIANGIIFYNAYIISLLLTENQKNISNLSINSLRDLSPVAWQHINFFGRYDFVEESSLIDIKKWSKI
ncbi:Tn3 family transposase [Candidatus Uabimicrobium helgolandensis]